MRKNKVESPYPFVFSTEIAVQVGDLNYGGHVGNEHYLLYAQETRIRFLQTFGHSEMKFGPYGLVLAEAHVEYFHELFHGDTIHIQLAVSAPTRVSFDCYYKLSTERNGSTLVAAHIKTTMVCFDFNERKTKSIPPELKTMLINCSEGK